MTAPGFNVQTQAMREHARRLDGIVRQIETAQQAIGQARINGANAYGILCSPLLEPIMGTIEAAGTAAVTTAHGVVNATVDGVNGMADTYDTVDQALGGNFEKIVEKLGELTS
ncbi:type VII secretion target [Lentzea jiangxiensis]|uniref:Excreted virulence factor EspC, type VII ESX diderm n=1 Tax=Lentzea jiangxiensis TaxID=641025 RepID=A0A1H0R2H9_9PSEU|nr:type VII secretion target [Lentzea jiangxiensis]SDP23731.1 Excreted virulence factor EspC, type VII ESX diderm [Lentzea jiangxiensis]